MGHFLRNGADCIMILGTTPVLLFAASAQCSHSKTWQELLKVHTFALLEATRQASLTSAFTCSSSRVTPKFCAWANFQIVKEAKRSLWRFVCVLLLRSYSSSPIFFLINGLNYLENSLDAVASLAPIPRFKTYLIREQMLLKWWKPLANLPLSEYHSASLLLVARDGISYILWKLWPRAH